MSLVHSPQAAHTQPWASLPVLAPMDRMHFTVVFRGDIRKLPGGPFSIKSDFGEPVSSGYGNAFTKADALEDALYRALPFIEDALKDPAYKSEPVAAILRQINRALGEAEATPASSVGTARSDVHPDTPATGGVQKDQPGEVR